MRRTLTLAAVALSLSLLGQQSFASAPADSAGLSARHEGAPIRVDGAITTPATYSDADIAALPQITLPLSRPGGGTAGSVTGASLEALALASDPVLPAGKNTQLRVSITVVGAHHRVVTVALGELDAGFGNHPALLTVDPRGDVDLVVPGDSTRLRSVGDVRTISVAVSTAAAVTPVAAGSVQVTAGSRSITLSAATLSRLPRHTLTVSFLAGTASQTHTESGPTLASVLLAARVLPLPDVVVTAVGDDGYGASVTAGEALLGGRELLLGLAEDGAALPQPRLVAAGDVKGGRYVSGIVALSVTGPSCR